MDQSTKDLIGVFALLMGVGLFVVESLAAQEAPKPPETVPVPAVVTPAPINIGASVGTPAPVVPQVPAPVQQPVVTPVVKVPAPQPVAPRVQTVQPPRAQTVQSQCQLVWTRRGWVRVCR